MANRVVVVTGGGRGIGRACCLRFAADGDRVVAAARTAAELEETRKSVQKHGGTCATVCADVSDRDEAAEVIRTALERFGRVDVLVNAAGVAPLSLVEELDPDVFDTLLSVNIRAVFYTCRAVWPAMSKQGGGCIVNISSVASVDPFPGFAAYGASKAWVNAWTRGLAEEGRARNIGVFSVAPGAVETRMLRDAFPDFPRSQALEPEAVAEVIHALCSPAFRHASGQTLFFKK